MTQAHKHNSMPNTVHSTLTTVARKKHPTISRFFHGKNQPQPQRQESFAPTPLSPEMKHHPPYHSDPNLLAEENEPAKENAKKPRAWKWPFPRNKNQRELPGQNDNEIQPIAIHNVVRNFPDTPSEDPYAPSDSHFAGSHVPEPESLVIAFQDKNLVTEIEAVEEVHNPSSDYERPDPLLRPVSSPLAPSTSRALRRVSSGKRLKKTLKSQANSEDLPSPHAKSQPSTELTNGDTSSLYKQAIHESIKQPIRHKKSLMLCDYCLMTVSTPALFATGEKGKGKEITFRFSPLAKIGLLRGAILREFLERTQASPSLLSTLHLCYFNDRDRAWIWLDEKLPLFTYNLQRECRLDLKPSTPHSIGVRIVLPDIERTMMVSFDQFTIVHDLLNQVLNAQKLRIKDTTGFSLFHVRLRIMLDPNRSITYYELQSHDTLECRIAPGKMDGTCITIFVPQTDSHHTIEVCLDQTVGDLISLLIRQLPQCDFSHWYHSALYYKPKEQGKGLWLDDYKYLYSYSIGTHEILEFKARYRPLVFDLRLYSSYAKSDDDQSVTLLLSQNIIVEQVLEMLHAICSFEFSAEFYGLYQHNGIQIANEVRLCEFLDNIANRRYEDTVKVHMIPLLLEVELIEEVSDDLENCRFEYLVDFSRPCRDLRSLLARRFGVKNKHACVLRFEDQDLDLKESLFDNSVTDKARIEFVHKNLRNQDSVESPVIDYVNNGCACIITPDLLADLPPNKMELGRSKSLMLTDMPNIWDDEIESEKNLRFERGSHNVSAATFNKLVIRLTSDQNLDLGFVKTFLLTYRAYTSPKILLQKLIERYNVIRSPHKSMNEFNMSKTKIQLRVINALKFWLELGFDFQDDGSLQRQMLDFIENVLYDDQPKMCRKLRILLLTIQGKIDQSDKQNVCVKPPPIKVNKASLPTSSLIELDPEEVARQLTLIDFNIYSKIKPFELLNQAWAKPKYKHRAKNVHCLVDRLNNMTLWVATVVLSYDEEFQRAKAISAFVKIAYHLYRLHNFSTLMAVYCGVQHGSITRLYRTWGKVDRATNKLLEDLTIVCDPQLGHSKMREEMLNADPPCLPYIIALFILQLFNCILLEVSSIINCTALGSMRFKLQLLGLFMRDLTLIDEGNPNLMQDGLINFLKCDLIYKSIRDVQMYQQQNYNFEVEPSISASLSSFQFVDEKTAYEHSEIFEPRVRRV